MSVLKVEEISLYFVPHLSRVYQDNGPIQFLRMLCGETTMGNVNANSTLPLF